MSANQPLPGWFAAALDALRRGDSDGWMAIYAPDAVHEFPFAPPGAPKILRGRDEIADYMRGLLKAIDFGDLSDVSVTQAPDTLLVEATGHHRLRAGDAPFSIGCVWVIGLSDGKVTHYRDYMNPRDFPAGVA